MVIFIPCDLDFESDKKCLGDRAEKKTKQRYFHPSPDRGRILRRLNLGVMSMHPLLKVDISQLSVAERIQLAEDLWDSILTTPAAVRVSEAQQQELDRRLEEYHQNPMQGSSWEHMKQRLGFS